MSHTRTRTHTRARVPPHAYHRTRTTAHQIEFVIKHYAGDVTYDATGFLDKNKDTLQKDLLVVVEGTTNQFISVMFPVIRTSLRALSCRWSCRVVATP
jgi:myosin heavy subunit